MSDEPNTPPTPAKKAPRVRVKLHPIVWATSPMHGHEGTIGDAVVCRARWMRGTRDKPWSAYCHLGATWGGDFATDAEAKERAEEMVTAAVVALIASVVVGKSEAEPEATP